MLVGLLIQNIVLIDHLYLEFDKGFTSLTGETGAGKSILLDALGLALGEKADSNLIRFNQDQAVVIATFDLSTFDDQHPLFIVCKEQGLFLENEIILKRVLQRPNKSKAFINDQPVTATFLKKCATYLIEIHGQHDNLLNESSHKRLLDDYAKKTNPDYINLLKRLEDSYTAFNKADLKLKEWDKTQDEALKKKAYYEMLSKDLNALNLIPHEEEELLQKRDGLQKLGKVIQTVESVLKGLTNPQDLVSYLYQLQKQLERIDEDQWPSLKNATKALERAGIEINEAQIELKDLFQAEKNAATELEQIDERLHQLRSAARKYYVTLQELYPLYEEAKFHLQTLEDSAQSRHLLDTELKQALDNYKQLEQEVFTIRQNSAFEFAKEVALELPDLKLEKARFEIKVSPSFEPVYDGGHSISFWVSMNPGQEMSPLSKTASGGESARLMLAIKVVSVSSGCVPTLIFDEIDTGVGGSVALAIGTRLKNLGKNVQVFSITHSPQVAACSRRQYFVSKKGDQGSVKTLITLLDELSRIEEIARMLSGDKISSEARIVANQLLLSSH